MERAFLISQARCGSGSVHTRAWRGCERLPASPSHQKVQYEARKTRCQAFHRNPCVKLAPMPAFKTGLLVLVAALSAYSQNSSGTLSGLVKDSSNAAVPNAHVTISNENTGLRRAVETNDDGTFRAPFLPVGSYSVQVQKDGFRSEIQKPFSLKSCRSAASTSHSRWARCPRRSPCRRTRRCSKPRARSRAR
jgi:hypothetical protein